MPPEPLPWDRKDFFKERKHERSESLGSVARWRESSSHHGGSRGFTRWGSGDFRRPPGHGKQGSWHVFPDDSGHGYAPSRPTDKSSDDDNSRRPVFRGEGKYNRSSRESKGSFGQRDWKGTNACETSNGTLNTPGRPSDTNSSQRSVDMLVYTSPTHSEPGNTWNCRQPHSKEEQHDKIDDSNGLSTCQKFDDSSLGSLDWKPLKWSRSGSLSSRGSGHSHSSSSKSMGGVDSNEANDGTMAANVGMLESPTGDAALYGSTANPFEDMASRKKPRLGWGEGLAKYEKKKVDGPEESVSKSGAEPTQSLGLSGTEKSPRFASFSDCASPATPSSVACSSSPGLEEKSFGKAMNVDSEVNNLCESVDPESQNQQEGSSFNLEKLDLNSLGTLGYSLSEFLQSDDASSVDSSFARSTAVSKLLLLKVDVLKTIEVTESEIDSLENELKALTSAARSSCPSTASSSSMAVETRGNCCEGGQDYVSSSIMRPAPLQVTSSVDIAEGELPLPNGQLEDIHANDKSDDVDSPGTATSKFVEPITLVKSAPSDVVSQCQSPANFDVSCAVETKINQSVGDALQNSMGVIACSDSTLVNDINSSRGNMLCQLIFASNKDAAKEASDAFTPLLPSSHYKHDIARVHDVACHDSVLEKFTKRKRFAKFKESVTILKFRALHHLWKEDLRLLSLRKSRAKSHKKFEPSLRITVNGYQKHRSSARSRFSTPGGSLSLVPTKEMLTYTSKLLSDSRTRQFRESLKMPALILDEREKTASRFLSTNGLVEDPCGFEKERTVINPWTVEEQQIFLDKFATFGKDFTKIASFLDHKTTADCVQFYYKNHKSDLFEKTKKKHEFGKNGKPASASTYLVASRKKWNRGINTVSLDVLGDASLLAAQADGDMLEEQVFSRRFCMGGGRSNYSKTIRRDSSILDRRKSSYSNLETERETVAADVLAGICGSFSSEAMGSCVTSSLDHGEGHQAVTKEPLTPDVMENLEEETCSGESCGEMEDPPDWTDEEKAAFIEAVSSYGKNFSMISRHVRTRSVGQCKVFFSKARKCLGLDAVQPSNGCIGSPDTDDNGGRDDSDAGEDACAVVKMDEDLPCTAGKADNDSCEPLKSMDLKNDRNGEEGTLRIDEPVVMEPKEEPEAICERGDADPCLPTEPVRPPPKESAAALVEVEEMVVTIRDARESCPISAAVLNDQCCKGLDEKTQADEKQQQRVAECPTSSTSYTAAAADTPGAGFSLNSNLEPKEEQLCLGLEEDPVTDRSCVLQQQRARSLPPDAAIDWFEKSNVRDRFSSAVGQDDEGCSSRRHLSGNAAAAGFSNELQMLRGYPIQVMPKEVNSGGSDRSREVMHQSWLSKHPSEGISFNSNHPLYMPQQQQDLYLLRKCSSNSSTRHADNGPSVTQVKLKQSSSLEDTERQPKKIGAGDFKLFGQKILSSTTPQQKDDKGEVGLNPPSSLVAATVLKPNNHLVQHISSSSSHTMDGGAASAAAAALLNFERTVTTMTSTSGGESRSYGFWDGSKIRTTGFSSSLPDSALLLAKYPAAFSNYSPVQLTTAATANSGISNECNNNVMMNGVTASAAATLFPSSTSISSSGNGVHVYRNLDVVRPFTLEVQQQQQQQQTGGSAGLYHHSELPRCNGLDALSSSLQQIVGGRGGVLVGGGPCNMVSDPVAAIKMHYAQTELQQQQQQQQQQQLAGQTGTKGIIIREDETTSWRDR